MAKSIALVLALLTSGCAPRLGAHVHRFSYKGITYYHCTVIADERDAQLAHSALDICKDAVEGQVPAYKTK